MNAKYIVCPECEGVGKAVDYFDLPETRGNRFNRQSETTYYKRHRSDGRGYQNKECEICKGTGSTLVVSAKGSKSQISPTIKEGDSDV